MSIMQGMYLKASLILNDGTKITFSLRVRIMDTSYFVAEILQEIVKNFYVGFCLLCSTVNLQLSVEGRQVYSWVVVADVSCPSLES